MADPDMTTGLVLRGPRRRGVRLGHRAAVILSCALQGVSCAFGRLHRRLCREPERSIEVCIESGSQGFKLIEVQELERAAAEHFGLDRIARSVVINRAKYLANARQLLRTIRPAMYFVDPRSGSQSFSRAVLQSLGLATLLAFRGVAPIVWLTDAPLRRWRLQAEILTACRGIALTLVSPTESEIRFAHPRFHGPVLMPLSQTTLDAVAAMREERNASPPIAVFIGSLYEPRTSELRRVSALVEQRGYRLSLITREAGGPRIPDEDYWRTLAQADVVFTTASQVQGPGFDIATEPHLVYRYTEALAAGAALVAPIVPGSEQLLEPGRHFAGYRTEVDAANAIADLLANPDRAAALGSAGQARIREVARSSGIWKVVVASNPDN